MDLGDGHNIELREYASGDVAIVESGTMDQVDAQIVAHLDLEVLSLEEIYETVQGVPASGSTAQVLRDAQTRIAALAEAPVEIAAPSPPEATQEDTDRASASPGIGSISQALSGQPCSADIYGDAWGASLFTQYFCKPLPGTSDSGIIHCVTNAGNYDSGYIQYPRWLDYFIFAADHNNDASTQIWKWVKIDWITNSWDWDLTNWDTIPARTWRHYSWKGPAWRNITARGLGPGNCRIHASVQKER
jgi:hypothetical protein